MLLQNLLLQCYYIFLHCYYLLLHQSLLPVITNSLLPIITSLLRYYYVVITSLCNLQNSCNNGFIITYYYIGLFHYYIIITHYVIISHYYLLLTGQLADEHVSVTPLLLKGLQNVKGPIQLECILYRAVIIFSMNEISLEFNSTFTAKRYESLVRHSDTSLTNQSLPRKQQNRRMCSTTD